ncbi:MAG TPA: NrfD/PsrC family molybdoenzyme membrane anchor subunit [Methylomirabilota bacterium]|jgi:polysulfide reductase chain C|nr:NrfD/PsrC family molybdoenzyme membrane anchor subunit [Methylomirabilota bacterium]
MEPGLLKSADWPLLIDLYFFLGGVAGGAFVIATVASLLDPHRYRDLTRVGYYVALLAIIPGPILLTVDLGIPSRFLHMLMVSKPTTAIGMYAITVGPFHLKPFSPMSAGAWALVLFSACAFLAALLTFLEDRGNPRLGPARVIIGIVGGVFGFFIAAYPGVLLDATARPLFISAHWLGALFLAVGAATGGAAIALILSLLGGGTADSLSRLMKITAFALILELVFLALFVVSVSATGSRGIREALAQLLIGSDAIFFWGGAVGLGLVIPLLLQVGGAIRKATPGMTALVSVLVLVGGFLVKYVIIVAGQRVLS